MNNIIRWLTNQLRLLENEAFTLISARDYTEADPYMGCSLGFSSKNHDILTLYIFSGETHPPDKEGLEAYHIEALGHISSPHKNLQLCGGNKFEFVPGTEDAFGYFISELKNKESQTETIFLVSTYAIGFYFKIRTTFRSYEISELKAFLVRLNSKIDEISNKYGT